MPRTIPPACGRGHALDEANTYVDGTGKWHCRRCHRERLSEHRARRRELREAEKARRIADRPTWPDVDLAWIAGIFEGEGTATITDGGRQGYVRSSISVTNTDREVLDPFHSMWPGSIRSVGFKSPNAREAWCWRIEGEAMMAFLLDVRPFIRTSRVAAKFDLLLEVQRIRRVGSRDPEYRAQLRVYRERMRVLNHRGRHDAPPAGSIAGIRPVA